ncbi:hypothetical protein Ade02nite_97060 [Paractinoplanes deccanensis]|uniref:DUF4262 domain-containing protein n=1 Tax=Paractinoplanes deccanensis TaxID=113561 RepID=A0ABQ3YM21_9ACTN|nr:DUF4262 domain-containing protein [Actinoplanes deccanensis]GID81065.1 hypothetical protein Ade02nite_97060 [Actinoplanes deccanensis]
MNDAEAVRVHLVRIEGLIAKHGWAIQGVGGRTPADPGCFYTVGLTAAGRPELCLAALSPPLSAQLLNAAVKIHLGAELKHGDETGDVASVPLRVISAPELEMNVAQALYGPQVLAVQLVWPDSEGNWPPSSRMAQRLFGEPWW